MLRGIRTLSKSAWSQKSSYSKTLCLPQTDFGPKIPTGERRADLIKKTSEKLYLEQLQRNNSVKDWILHDGPPYANGDLHLGHALNKIVKDIINRWELIFHGKRVNYRPGWDCHGLPIEMKSLSENKGAKCLNAVELRRKCRELASSMIEKQREQFKEFAIMSDFQDCYITMDHAYEIKQLEVFLKLKENGLLTRQLKPVWWGCETKTALAEAELEYNDEHASVAAYVKFPVNINPLQEHLRKIYPSLDIDYRMVSLLVWTSTPWTIPANEAISVNKAFTYTLLKDGQTDELVIVADKLADLVSAVNQNFKRVEPNVQIKGCQLLDLFYANPATREDGSFPVLHGDHVSDLAGTGLVHTAPAHGGEDYALGVEHGLPVKPCADESGRFLETNIAKGFQSLAGLKVTSKEGILKYIRVLDENGMIYDVNKKYIHSYPYDWRSKTPVIQRATPQWFVNVEKIKGASTKAVDNMNFHPENGRNRLRLFVVNRNEWCISRQRAWGVPLPMLYRKESDEPLEDIDTIRYVVARMNEFGTDSWFIEEEDISRWLPPKLKDAKEQYIKGKDTMDVWFDSGTSWSTLSADIENRFRDPTPLADVYLEGTDQHRGWFQSSLLNRIVVSGVDGKGFLPVSSCKTIISHGFILDANNEKMSKSKGNVISPLQIIVGGGKPFVPTLGTDGLRLWIASSSYTQDVNAGSEIMKRILDNLKKLRVTLKYLLGNLNDFELSCRIPYQQLFPLDKLVLSQLFRLQENCVKHYDVFNFSRVVKDINTHMSVNLSSQYFDISKDALYTECADSLKRRSIQTVLFAVLNTYVGLLAPIQPLLAQEAWESYPIGLKRDSETPFLCDWQSAFQLPVQYLNEDIEQDFSIIWYIRNAINKYFEGLRSEGLFKSNLETDVNILVDEHSSLGKLLRSHLPMLEDYFLVSNVTINKPSDHTAASVSLDIEQKDILFQIYPAKGHKCPRCWKRIASLPTLLCHRCESVIENLNA